MSPFFKRANSAVKHNYPPVWLLNNTTDRYSTLILLVYFSFKMQTRNQTFPEGGDMCKARQK